MPCEVWLVPAGYVWLKRAVLIQNIDKAAAHFSKFKPELGISLTLGSHHHEMEKCLVSPWLHEPVRRCFRVSDPDFLPLQHPRSVQRGNGIQRDLILAVGWKTVL